MRSIKTVYCLMFQYKEAYMCAASSYRNDEEETEMCFVKCETVLEETNNEQVNVLLLYLQIYFFPCSYKRY